jgi:hypothetical protein
MTFDTTSCRRFNPHLPDGSSGFLIADLTERPLNIKSPIQKSTIVNRQSTRLIQLCFQGPRDLKVICSLSAAGERGTSRDCWRRSRRG